MTTFDVWRKELEDLADAADNDEFRQEVARLIAEREEEGRNTPRTPWDDAEAAGYTWDEYLGQRRERRRAATAAYRRTRRWAVIRGLMWWLLAVLVVAVLVVAA